MYHNTNLERESKGTRFEDLTPSNISKDSYDNDGEINFTIEVNDNTYSYVNKSERDADYDKLIASLKSTRLESADEVINSITEVLLRASGETIQAAAEAAGLSGIKYVGDSMFEVEES